ncbi:MAG: hypothetical protein MH252_07345 [Thermosynechococcaceae cyanobacterium MS004]|nr:hypothetical protein [Thermosynechococcaceae cyanobacterium MS004]
MTDAIPPELNPEQLNPEQNLASALQRSAKEKPPAIAPILETLQQLERAAKRRDSLTYDALLGTWRLVLVSRTKRPSASKTHTKTKPDTKPQTKTQTKGQWIPAWVSIEITYAKRSPSLSNPVRLPNLLDPGTVQNCVKVGALKLTLSGPTQLYPNNILAFDFTQLTLEVGNLTLYRGGIRGGTAQEIRFYQQSLKTQAFFRFFWFTTLGLAARGRGGGLALWSKVEARL